LTDARTTARFAETEDLIFATRQSARSTSGLALEDAAAKIGVPPDPHSRWEDGKEDLTIAQLRKAAGVYKRPLAV